MMAASLMSLTFTVCLLRKGSTSLYFTQNSGYLADASPKSSSRTITGQKARGLMWNVELA